MNNNMFFIIGLRRSGTSFIRREILKSRDVDWCLFEPHDLFYAVMLQKFNRFKKEPFISTRINKFRKNSNTNPGKKNKLCGAKFALNPGIDAMDWRYFITQFPGCKIIFIKRNIDDNYNSYYNEDKKIPRGYIEKGLYEPFWNFMNGTFERYVKNHASSSCMIDYDRFFVDFKDEMSKIWKTLGIPALDGLHKDLIKPSFFGGEHNE